MPGNPLSPKTDAEDNGCDPFLSLPTTDGNADVEGSHFSLSISKYPYQRETGGMIDHVREPRPGELINIEGAEGDRGVTAENTHWSKGRPETILHWGSSRKEPPLASRILHFI